MNKIILFFVVVAFALSACNKNQKVVKELDGTWRVIGRTTNGVADPANSYSGVKYTFKSCRVKKGFCDGSLVQPDSTKGTVTTSFTYGIKEKGTKITINYSLLLFTTSIEGNIDEFTSKKFVYSYTATGSSDKLSETLEKE